MKQSKKARRGAAPTPATDREITVTYTPEVVKVGPNLVVRMVITTSDSTELYGVQKEIPLGLLAGHIGSQADLDAKLAMMMRDYHETLGEALRYEAGAHLLDTVIMFLLNHRILPVAKKPVIDELLLIRSDQAAKRLERLIGATPGQTGRPRDPEKYPSAIAGQVLGAIWKIREKNKAAICSLSKVAEKLRIPKATLQKRLERNGLSLKTLQRYADRTPAPKPPESYT